MTNDMLEQFTEDYFKELGYFTQHNVKYRINNRGVHSDIDVLAIHPKTNNVVVVSCKSEQLGININSTLENIIKKPNKRGIGGAPKKKFKEIVDKEYSNALRVKVKELTNQNHFIFILAVAKYKGDKTKWENFPLFNKNLPSCKIKILSLEEMIKEIQNKMTLTPSKLQLTRVLQLLKIGGGVINFK